MGCLVRAGLGWCLSPRTGSANLATGLRLSRWVRGGVIGK